MRVDDKAGRCPGVGATKHATVGLVKSSLQFHFISLKNQKKKPKGPIPCKNTELVVKELKISLSSSREPTGKSVSGPHPTISLV